MKQQQQHSIASMVQDRGSDILHGLSNASILMTLSDPLQAFSYEMFRTLVQQLTRLQLT